MPEGELNYDPATPEGEAIGELFRGCKNLEDDEGGWNGGDIVQRLSEWFARLGIDVEGPARQVDRPQAVSRETSPEAVAEVLTALPGFTTLPGTEREGFFTVSLDEPGFEEIDSNAQATIVAFPYAPPARVCTALAVLRSAGYDATAHNVDPRGRTIHVHASVVHAGPADACVADPGHPAAAEPAWRHGDIVLDSAGLVWTRASNHDRAQGANGLTHSDGRPCAPAGGHPEETPTRPLTLLMRDGKPAQPGGVRHGEPPALPPEVLASIDAIVAYNWEDEEQDYEAQDPLGREGHVFVHLYRISDHLGLPSAP